MTASALGGAAARWARPPSANHRHPLRMPARVAIASATPEARTSRQLECEADAHGHERRHHRERRDECRHEEACAHDRQIAERPGRELLSERGSLGPREREGGSRDGGRQQRAEHHPVRDAGIACGADQRTADGAPDPDERSGREDDEDADKCGG